MRVPEEVNGYPAWPTVRVGRTLRLHLSTKAARVRAEFVRWGRVAHLVDSVTWAGDFAEDGDTGRDWAWPAREISIPSDWPTGVYVVRLLDDRTPLGAGGGLDARHGRALFVVAPTEPSGAMLYKLPLSTYHAYNTAGGACLYTPGEVGSRVTIRRPGGGIGGPVKGLPDSYDPFTPRQSFTHWDGKFVAWMERAGFEFDVCTDLDVHEGIALEQYRLLVSSGHDEYWSAPTRAAVTAYRDRGGAIANFGGNTCWWRTAFDGAVITCRKTGPGIPIDADPDSITGCPDKWWEHDQEGALLGSSYRNAGGHWEGRRAALGYTVQAAAHWIYQGTGLSDGDEFGSERRLIGYECDGVALDTSHSATVRPNFQDGTPERYELLGLARLPPDAGWHFPIREQPGGPRAATLGIYADDGIVFNAGTTDWPRLLESDPLLATITSNVLTRLSGETGGAP